MSMRMLAALVVLTIVFVPVAIGQEPIQVPLELQAFVQKGWEPIALESADLNGDGTKDVILVLQQRPNDSGDVPLEEGQRTLLIVLRRADGRLTLEKRNDKIILCATCGGTMGDPFAGIIAGRKTFAVHHYGGSGWRWTTRFRFNYSRIDSTWQLVEAEETTFHASDPERRKRKVYRPPKRFGKIDIADFDPEHYLK